MFNKRAGVFIGVESRETKTSVFIAGQNIDGFRAKISREYGNNVKILILSCITEFEL